MNYQAMKRHGANLIAYYYVKEASLKSYILHDNNNMTFVLLVYFCCTGTLWLRVGFLLLQSRGNCCGGLLIVVASLVAEDRL